MAIDPEDRREPHLFDEDRPEPDIDELPEPDIDDERPEPNFPEEPDVDPDAELRVQVNQALMAALGAPVAARVPADAVPAHEAGTWSDLAEAAQLDPPGHLVEPRLARESSGSQDEGSVAADAAPAAAPVQNETVAPEPDSDGEAVVVTEQITNLEYTISVHKEAPPPEAEAMRGILAMSPERRRNIGAVMVHDLVDGQCEIDNLVTEGTRKALLLRTVAKPLMWVGVAFFIVGMGLVSTLGTPRPAGGVGGGLISGIVSMTAGVSMDQILSEGDKRAIRRTWLALDEDKRSVYRKDLKDVSNGNVKADAVQASAALAYIDSIPVGATVESALTTIANKRSAEMDAKISALVLAMGRNGGAGIPLEKVSGGIKFMRDKLANGGLDALVTGKNIALVSPSAWWSGQWGDSSSGSAPAIQTSFATDNGTKIEVVLIGMNIAAGSETLRLALWGTKVGDNKWNLQVEQFSQDFMSTYDVVDISAEAAKDAARLREDIAKLEDGNEKNAAQQQLDSLIRPRLHPKADRLLSGLPSRYPATFDKLL